MNKNKVVIKREWHKPQVELWVTSEEVGLSVTLADFIQALAFEVGNPARLLTQAQLLSALRQGADRVAEKLKQETNKIV